MPLHGVMAEEVLALLALLEPAGSTRPCFNGAEVKREREREREREMCTEWVRRLYASHGVIGPGHTSVFVRWVAFHR
jgi:hypothetical protein